MKDVVFCLALPADDDDDDDKEVRTEGETVVLVSNSRGYFENDGVAISKGIT
jgi:hypothetical protein